jgi:hypothetical protein
VFIYSAGIELVLARQALCHLSCVPSSLLLYLGEALEFLSGTGFGPPMDACLVAGIIEHTTIGLFVEGGGGLTNYLPRLALNCHFSHLCLLSSWDYKGVPPHTTSFFHF